MLADRIRFAISRLMPCDWWWSLWTAGIVVTWSPWLILLATLPITRRTMDGPISDVMFAGMASFGLIAPIVASVRGFAIFVRCARAKTLDGNFLSEPSVAFLCIVAAGTLAFAATIDNPDDFVSGVMTNCVVGQLAPGLYFPFAIPVITAYVAAKTTVRRRAWIAVVIGATVWWASCFAGSTIGYAH